MNIIVERIEYKSDIIESNWGGWHNELGTNENVSPTESNTEEQRKISRKKNVREKPKTENRVKIV